jgi:hypothetical protein
MENHKYIFQLRSVHLIFLFRLHIYLKQRKCNADRIGFYISKAVEPIRNNHNRQSDTVIPVYDLHNFVLSFRYNSRNVKWVNKVAKEMPPKHFMRMKKHEGRNKLRILK